MLLVGSPFGCDDGGPIDPCDRDLACNVNGVDIAILDVEPIWTDEQEYDADVDMRVVQPGDQITVEVLVMNRGTIDSHRHADIVGRLSDIDRQLTARTTIEPLAVGERATYTLVFDVPAGVRFSRRDPLAPAADPDGLFYLEHDSYVDADSANDERPGFEFHVDAPVLEFHLDGVPDTMLGQHSYDVTLTVANLSPTAPFAGGLEVEFCAQEEGPALCENGAVDAFSPFNLGPIPADGSRTFPRMLRLTKDALPRFEEPSHVAIVPCVYLGTDDGLCLPPPDFDPDTDHSVTALPDLLLECEPFWLLDGEGFEVDISFCDHDPSNRTYSVVQFDATEGECWRAEFRSSSSGSIVLRHAQTLDELPEDDALDCRRVEHTGKQLIIVHPATTGGAPSGMVWLDRLD